MCLILRYYKQKYQQNVEFLQELELYDLTKLADIESMKRDAANLLLSQQAPSINEDRNNTQENETQFYGSPQNSISQ